MPGTTMDLCGGKSFVAAADPGDDVISFDGNSERPATPAPLRFKNSRRVVLIISKITNLRIAVQAILGQLGDMKKLILIVSGLVAFGNKEARPADKVDFARDIQPILKKSCVECHGPEKPKGKLRLDTKDGALKGGKDGVVIEPGNADKSEVYRRITLPADNDDVMPNKGDKLTKAQTDLIRDWINQGATWPDGVVLVSVDAKEEKPKEAAPEIPKLPDYKPSAAELKAVATLESLGAAARPIA